MNWLVEMLMQKGVKMRENIFFHNKGTSYLCTPQENLGRTHLFKWTFQISLLQATALYIKIYKMLNK